MNIEETVNGKTIGRFELKFKNSSSTFYAGDIICGTVELQVSDNIEIGAIRAQFRGECYVYWQRRNSDGSDETLKDHHTIWNQLFTIWGNKVNENACGVTLVRGDHKFPFAVRIPFIEIPSSFEHRNGAVRYWVKLYIDSTEYENYRYVPFTILQKIDVNEKHLQSKVSNDADQTMCCSCFGSGSLSLAANLDRSGYCPGESIAVNCRGKNQARRDMGGIKARLIQNIVYRVGSSTKREECIVSAIGGNKIEKGRTKVWENQLLKIPPVPPTIENFGLISLLYKVQITMVVPNGVDLQFNLPITIGTIPRSNFNYKVNLSFDRCSVGIECFNHSSKSYNFPLLAYVPNTAFVNNFIFIPIRNLNSSEYQLHRSISDMIKDDEKQLLIGGSGSSSRNTFVT